MTGTFLASFRKQAVEKALRGGPGVTMDWSVP